MPDLYFGAVDEATDAEKAAVDEAVKAASAPASTRSFPAVHTRALSIRIGSYHEPARPPAGALECLTQLSGALN